MARSAKSRSSRNTRKPVTIDLDAEEVVEDKPSEEQATEQAASKKAAAENDQASSTETADAENAEENASSDEPSTSGDTEKNAIAASTSGNRFSSVSGGVIGGLIALVVGAGLQWVGILPSFAPQAPLEQVDLTPLQDEIASLKTELTTVASNTSSGISAEAQTALDSALGASQAAADKTTALDQTLQALSAKVDEIQSNISAGAAGESAGLEALASRLSNLESELAANTDDIAPQLQSAIDELSSGLVAQQQNMAQMQTDLTDQISEVATQLAAMEEKVAGGTSGASVAAAIASAGLKSAIDRGGTFMTELEAYATVAGDSETVVELRDYAASGVATISQLTDQFPSVHNRIIAVGEGLAEDASVTDRLMASARSLVQVRTVGDVEGETPDQIAARIEARLKESDLAAALAEWDSLPDAAKEASADFANRMRARQAVDAMVAKALSGAMAATTPASN